VVFAPFMNKIFHTVPFSLKEVVAIGAAASLVLWVEELRKWIIRRRERGLGPEAAGPGKVPAPAPLLHHSDYRR
jgi:hypothetical protein